MTPAVSVLIPTFNRANLVGRAIQSVLDQGVDCEVLVVDNGSSDGTWEVLQAWQERDPRVCPTRWMFNNSTECYPALLEMATGEYVNFFADDDEMLPGGLARKLEVLDRHPEIGMVFSTVRYMDFAGQDQGEAAWGRYQEEDRIGGSDYFDSLIMGNYVPWPSATFRRALVPSGDRLRNPAFGPAKDWQFWLELARRTQFAFLRQPTVRLGLHEGQETQVLGVKAGGFVESYIVILQYWMLEWEPPYIPSAQAWEGHLKSLAGALWASHPDDQEHCVQGLKRLHILRKALDVRLEAATPGSGSPEAFLHELDWSDAEWGDVLRSYLEAFAPGEPVALVLIQDPAHGVPPPEAEQAVLQVVAATGREAFPDVVLVHEPGALLATLRNYANFQWVPTGVGRVEELEGPKGQRLAEARRRLAAEVRS